MPKPVPTYIAKMQAMIQGERIVITEEITVNTARRHAKAINPALKAMRRKGRLIVEYPDPKTPEQVAKARERLNKYLLRSTSTQKSGAKKPPESDFQEAVTERFDDGWQPNPTL